MVDLERIHQRLELLAGYLRELRRLHEALAAGLPDLDEFAAAVARFVS